jgi:hypothetical protein
VYAVAVEGVGVKGAVEVQAGVDVVVAGVVRTADAVEASLA